MSPQAAEQTRIARQYQADVEKRRGERDGVVVTPVEVVDFQVRAVVDQLAAQSYALTDPEVQITDPFAGTGIYLARLMQLSGLTPDELDDLYHHRMQAIEIDPDAAAIADTNLRTVFEELAGTPARHSIVRNEDTFTITDDTFWKGGPA